MTTFEMLQELLAQNEFELLLPEDHTANTTEQDIRLVYQMNDTVESFLVEGDEFAIIVKNPQKTPEEWEHFIKEEMEEECGNRQPVRLKFGYSYLREMTMLS